MSATRIEAVCGVACGVLGLGALSYIIAGPGVLVAPGSFPMGLLLVGLAPALVAGSSVLHAGLGWTWAYVVLVLAMSMLLLLSILGMASIGLIFLPACFLAIVAAVAASETRKSAPSRSRGSRHHAP